MLNNKSLQHQQNRKQENVLNYTQNRMENAMRNGWSEKRVVQIFLEATVRVNLIIQEREQQNENTGPIGRSLQHG